MSQDTIEIGGITYQLVTLDFETYYGDDYTLTGKRNMSEYIRDARFHAHGVGIKLGAGKTLWYTGRNIPLALRAIDWSKSALVAHNCAFDGFILSQIYGHVPAFYIDTLAMARACHGHHTYHDLDTVAKLHGLKGKTKRSALADTKNKPVLTDAEERALGGYCIDDTDDTCGIFWPMFAHMPDKEMQLIDLTIRMCCDPVLEIDIPRAEAELEREVGGKVAALLKSGATPEQLLSNDKFAALLYQAGVRIIPRKISPSTGKAVYAFAKTDQSFKDLMSTSDPQVVALCNARLKLKSSIGESRAVRLIEAGKDGGKLPVLLNYSGAHTHRWSGGNKMNLQNLKRGGELRRSIIAPKGHVVVVADSAQIEARVLAWLAGQSDLLRAFAEKRDTYSEFASVVYGRHVDRKAPAKNAAGEFVDANGQVVADYEHAHKPDFIPGFVGKTCILGLGYGMGAVKLQATLKSGAGGPPVDMTQSQCQHIVNLYRSRNHRIPALWDSMDGIILNMFTGCTGEFGPLSYGKNYIQLPSGLFLQYYGLHGEVADSRKGPILRDAQYLNRNGKSKLYGGLLAENVTQALARDIVADQMLTINGRGRVVMMSHDEVVAVCPENEADDFLRFMIQTMSTAPDWAEGLPLAAEGGWDHCYSK